MAMRGALTGLTLALAAGMGLILGSGGAEAQQRERVRIAFGDIPAVENLHFLIALERAKEKGLDIELNSLRSEDIAAQAIVGGQADVGVGTPYALIQRVNAPIRMFLHWQPLRFFPIVAADTYKTWADLNGHEIAVHSRGSGTEAIIRLAAQRNNIRFSNISYIPGSEVRANAMLRGNIKATIVDSANRRMLMERAPGRFTLLPLEGVSATDEALFANREWLEKNPRAAEILVESILTTFREIQANPEVVTELRRRYRLLPNITAQQEADILPYFREITEARVLPMNGGGAAAVQDDFAFFTLAGQLQGEASALKVEDFWDFGPLNRVLARIGNR